MSTQKDGTQITGYMGSTAKQQTGQTQRVFQGSLNPGTYMQVSGDAPINAWTVPAAPKTGCQTKIADYSYIQPIYINQSTDSYDQPIDGGLVAGQKLDVETSKTGQRTVRGIIGALRDHLPWLSKLYARGASLTDYGDMPIPDPNNPGHSIAAPGTKDKAVQGKLITVLRDVSSRPRLIPDGTTTKFDPSPIPLDPPRIIESVGAGPNGDNLQRQYAVVWTGTADSEMGPASEWVRGYMSAAVTIPAVPAGSMFSSVTGQKVLRRTEGTDTWNVLTTYGDTTTHTFTDTTPDASLGAAYTAVNTEIVVIGGGGGGGGGGSTGPGAATYGISVELDGPNNDPVAWDHIIEGDDVYLNVSHTDGLTIPTGGDGDYEIDTHLWIGTDLASNVDSQDWTVETILNIEHWRSGVLLKSYTDQDWFGMSAADYANVGFINDIPIQLSTSVPACLAGDVIKTSVTATGSGAAHFGTYVDRTSSLTWVSINRTGKVSSSGTAATYQMSNNPATTSSTQLYVPWDTILYGHDMYLDVAHTDGLTIPVGGDGDYHIDTELLFQDGTTSTTPPWDIQFWLSIEVWRAGVRQQYLVDQDIYGSEASFSDTLRQFKLSATMPSLLAGDVVKIGWFYTNGPGPTFGFQWIDNTQSNCWVSIAKFG